MVKLAEVREPLHPYAEYAYAESLPHIGVPLAMPEWRCSLLTREIPGGGQDAAGVYPITPISKDADISGGLDRLRQLGLVSVVMVIDDVHRPDHAIMERHFQLYKPFKTHYLHRPNAQQPAYDRHHRYEVKKAYKNVHAGILDMTRYGSAWRTLYKNLVVRHHLKGTHDFPAVHHDYLEHGRGITAIGAWKDDHLVSAHLWVTDDETAHSHLAASSDEGYKLGAAYAVNDFALRHFGNLRLINFGGGAGLRDDAHDGLAKFKRGFSNDTAMSYLCGAVLDEVRYAALGGRADYFPAYRAG